jgi:phage terminase large subunit GpA-like protein
VQSGGQKKNVSKNPEINYIKLDHLPELIDLDLLDDMLNELPTKKVTSNIVETSERIRRFPKASPFPGPHRFSRSPYMYEIAMELSPQSPTEVINIMKGGQLGATANSTESLILFKIAEDPGPVLAMVPTVEFMKKWDESRIMPMIQESGLTDKLTSTYKRNSQHGGNGNAMGRKSWFGGRLDTITFAQLNQLRNMSYQIIIIEDAEELTNTAQRSDQGNIKKVAFARTKSYTGRRKILDISTPIDREFSHIYREFLKGDQRYYYIECPECGHSQRLEWKHLKFEKNDHNHIIKGSVYYECQGKNCDYQILDQDKGDFLPCEEMGGTAKWIPHNADKAAPLTKSYQFSTLYAGAGFDTWEQLAQQFVDAQGNPDELKAFVNLVLGEPWDDYTDAPAPEILHTLKGTYKKGFLPGKEEGGIIYAMMGADVQAGNKRNGEWLPGKEPRIEASLWGYGLNGRSWLIDHYIIKGTVNNWKSGAFREFREMIMNKEFPIMPVKIFIDAGHETANVKSFCSGSNNIFPIMGDGNIKKGYFRKVELQGYTSGQGGPLPMYELSTNSLKWRLYNNLGARRDNVTGEYPYGYIQFPVDLDHGFFEQLTSERPEPKFKEGRIVGRVFTQHGANEAMDCKMYSDEAREVYMFEVCETYGYEATNIKFFEQFVLDKFGYQYPKLEKVTA